MEPIKQTASTLKSSKKQIFHHISYTLVSDFNKPEFKHFVIGNANPRRRPHQMVLSSNGSLGNFINKIKNSQSKVRLKFLLCYHCDFYKV